MQDEKIVKKAKENINALGILIDIKLYSTPFEFDVIITCIFFSMFAYGVSKHQLIRKEKK